MKSVVVIGSAVMDLVARSPKLPRPGETVIGSSYASIPGGKGANQAVAAARLGADVMFISCVGNDDHGRALLASLNGSGVNTEHVTVHETAATGIAMIAVNELTGENCIVVVPAASGYVTPEQVQRCESVIAEASILVCSLELPLDAISAALSIARRNNVQTIMNPAPAIPLPDEMLRMVSILTPNEHEAAMLASMSGDDYQGIAKRLRELGPENVIITMGENGALVCDHAGEFSEIAAYKAGAAVDTTAAGDCFTGALAAALASGKSLIDSARFASIAAGISVTRHGAQTSLPTLAEVKNGVPSSISG